MIPDDGHAQSVKAAVQITSLAEAVEASKLDGTIAEQPAETQLSESSGDFAASGRFDCDDDLPTDVDSPEKLGEVPARYLSDDLKRPLLSRDSLGNKYKHALKPMFYSVIFILLVEALERFSYYGVNYTQTSFLTGQYNENWNANMTSVSASTYVSTSTAIAYTAPFLGAIVADNFIGDYWTIVSVVSLLYIPGLLLIALTADPYLLGPTFNFSALTAGLLALYPIGAGGIKGVVNVFGAKQFHPILQSDMIETYYVKFYMCINIGSLFGGIIVPIVAQTNVFIAYLIPVVMLSLGAFIFLAGTPRFVRMTPQGKTNTMILKALGASLWCFSCSGSKDSAVDIEAADIQEKSCCKRISFSRPSLKKVEKSNGGKFEDSFVDSLRMLLAVIPISALVVPFNIAYSQMATTFIVQGTVMQPAGFIDAAMMQNADALSVLFFGFMVSQFLYPALARRNIRIKTTHKFAIGTFLGCLAMICAIIVDLQIHTKYEATGEKISILWQAFSFIFIGAGEIFAVSAAYEAAFVVAPKQQKAFASAINLFFIGGIPNFISSALYNGCSQWFTNSQGTTDISTIQTYVTSNVQYYFIVLLAISCAGTLICLIPPITRWVDNIEYKAREMNDQRGSASSSRASVSKKSMIARNSSRVMDSSAIIRLH